MEKDKITGSLQGSSRRAFLQITGLGAAAFLCGLGASAGRGNPKPGKRLPLHEADRYRLLFEKGKGLAG